MVAAAQCCSNSVIREHVADLKEMMWREGMSAVVLFHTSNMLAFTGTPHASSDRLTCGAVTRDGQVLVVCPAFERPAVTGAEQTATIHTWKEDEDAYRCFADALAASGVESGVLGMDGRVWYNAWQRFAEACDGLRLESADALLREVRICKSPAEQSILRAAHRRGERPFIAMRDLIRPGVSELDLCRELSDRFRGEGLRLYPLIQSGPNGAIPHNPMNERMLREGDTVVFDSVTVLDGYHNDLTRTYAVGEPSSRAKRAYRAVRRAQEAAIDAVRPGAQCGQIDRIARRVIDDAGFGEFFTHRLGHGMGIECHEPPYLNGSNEEALRPGMCFTIEPGVYVPGEFGIRIEDDVLVTGAGCEVISGDLPTDVSDAFLT